MYSIDGVALHNPTYGWRFKQPSNPWSGVSRQLVDFNSSGRDGTIQVRGYSTTPTITLVVDTPLTYLDDLRQLFRLGATLTLTADASRGATVELVTATVETLMQAGTGLYRVTAVMRLPGVYWRDTATTDYGPTTLTSSGQTVTVFTPSTAPVRDALISVKGSITGLAVAGSLGTYFSYAPNVPAGSYLTFDATLGRAWTGSSVFAQTTEVTGSIANGPGPYFLECVGTSNPGSPGSPLTVTWTAMSGGTVTVRGRNSYDL